MIATCRRCEELKFVDNEDRLCSTCTKEIEDEMMQDMENVRQQEPTRDMMIDAGLST